MREFDQQADLRQDSPGEDRGEFGPSSMERRTSRGGGEQSSGSVTGMGFKGWPASALDFFDGLEADNSKAYWLSHKDVYERDVKAPMEALLSELTKEFGAARLFRPYRDTRFSKDKSPYKTTAAGMIGSCYIQLSADGLLAGAGVYHMETDQLERYRAAVAADASGRKLETLVDSLRKAGLDVHGSDVLKTAPRGYPRDHPRVELLRSKGLVVMKSWAPASWLSTAAAKKRIVDVFHAARPLLKWLDTNVGQTAGVDTVRSTRSGRSVVRS
jgi:uncharacterized protein (TIGR02453 family)